MKKIFHLLLVLLLFFCQNCKKEDSPTEPEEQITDNGNIKTGTTVDLGTQTVGTAGGTIKITKANDPLNGMEVTVLPSAFTKTQNLKITYAPVMSHSFDPDFAVASPLIKISSATEFASKNITLKVPLKLNTGEIAMPFFFNIESGTLEAMPIVDLTQTYIQFSTRRLSSNPNILKKSNRVADEYSNIIIFSILESKLEGKTVLATGFEPGYDDWEFINWGSYIAPGGHCAGQSISALYYFSEKKKSLGQLFHKYDSYCDKNNPTILWCDNPKGYRFASQIQKDYNMSPDGISDKYEFQEKDPRFTWWSFIMAMVLTKEPQYLCVYNKGTGKGHAVIVYKIDLTQRKLYLADPNFPNNRNPLDGSLNVRTVTYNNTAKKFEPYVTKLRADLPDMTFNDFAFFGKYIFIDKNTLDTRFDEFIHGTIGDGEFPTYKLYVGSTSGAELTDGMTVTKASLDLVCKSTECDSSFAGTDNLQPIEFYDDQGNAYGISDNRGIANHILNQGSNKLGILIYGLKKGSGRRFIDFKWVTINYTPVAGTLTIDPNPLDAALNGEYEFKASYSGSLPAKYKCYWGFPGETSYKTKENDLTMTHQFKKEGNYTVTCDVFDITTTSSPKLGNASASVAVTKKPLSDLYGLDGLFLSITGECEYSNSTSKYFTFSVLDISQNFSKSYPDLNRIIWSGNNFKASYKYPKLGIVAGDTTYITGTVKGTVSDDGLTIATLSITEDAKNNRTPYTYSFAIDVSNFPIKKNISSSFYTFSEYLKGAQVGTKVTRLYYKATGSAYPDPGWIEVTLKTMNYNSTATPPELTIMFQ